MKWLLLLIPALIAGIVLLLWRYRRQPEVPGPAVEVAPPPRAEPPYGWLLRQGSITERQAIMAFPWRIGRSSKNDLCIDDPSISRRHAEIRRDEDGYAQIVDLESLNGIYINNEKTGSRVLREGDRIEIGDIIFHYTVTDETAEQSGD